jgi:transcriptional regulator with XRE-family HTH domain
VLPFWYMGTRSTNDPFYLALGEALKKARLEADVTPSQAAASAGLSSSNAIGRYEHAHRTPDVKTLDALAVTYNVKTESLIEQARTAASQIKKGQDGTRKEEE